MFSSIRADVLKELQLSGSAIAVIGIRSEIMHERGTLIMRLLF
jgi:hypothetical protein